MTISVLISTYHKERPDYLDAALRSVWTEQERKPDQIVLIEDGPLTEGLYSVINKWQRILQGLLIVVKKERNEGLAAALNLGIPLCKGELIARMDSDDISTPKRFLLQEKYMAEHSEVDVIGGALKEFNDAGTLSNVRRYPASMSDVLKTMYRASPLGHPCTMFRNRVFKDGFRYSKKYPTCEDITMWYNLAHAGKIINNIPDIVLCFRRNDSIIDRRGHKKAWSEFRAYNNGIYKLWGLFTYKYIFSIARLTFRLMPKDIIRFFYGGKLRKIVANDRM